jgi:hypothetical protein
LEFNRHETLYQKYKDEILFIGISSFEDFPLPSVNPFSPKYAADKFVGMFPGFLHMLREPEKVFPPHVAGVYDLRVCRVSNLSSS